MFHSVLLAGYFFSCTASIVFDMIFKILINRIGRYYYIVGKIFLTTYKISYLHLGVFLVISGICGICIFRFWTHIFFEIRNIDKILYRITKLVI